ncbi:hypothetical protein DMJ13_27380 [halophilic archaeon]|nr:hypothetical protein DMJ13_27380 [halophilic archaeon]
MPLVLIVLTVLMTDDDRATVKLSKSMRDELRRYKAEHGITYSEAVERLLDTAGWEFHDSDES